VFDWSKILPPARNQYEGHPSAFYFLILQACMFTFRGSVHYFAPDGGTGIIAGLPLATYSDGAVQAIISGMGLVGVGHLKEAILVWLILVRYRALIPLTYLVILGSKLLALALLATKPMPVVPPGQVGNSILVPIVAGFFLLSIRRSSSIPSSS
jgi:hypothetical protein